MNGRPDSPLNEGHGRGKQRPLPGVERRSATESSGPDSDSPRAVRSLTGPFADVLAAARAGCPEAIQRLLQRHRGALWRLAFRESSPALRVKVPPSDLVQETLIQAHRKLHQFRGDSLGQFAAWLNRILTSKLAIQRRRYEQTSKRAIGREFDLVAAGSQGGGGRGAGAADALAGGQRTPGSHAANKELGAMMRAALVRLPENYQQVIVMRNWQGRSFGEIAAAMGRSPDAARKLWTRAVDRLAAELDRSDEQ